MCAIRNGHSTMLSLTVFHQRAVQFGVRKVSLAMILLYFVAIADEFGGLHRFIVARQTSLGMRRRTGNGLKPVVQCNDWGLVRICAGVDFGPAPETDRRDVLWEALGSGEPVVMDVVSDLEPRAPEPWVPA